MIEINLDPNMFTIGPLLITWHGFFTAVGLALGLALTQWLVRVRGVTADDVYGVALPAIFGGIVGARLLFAAENWWLFVDRPLSVLAINEGGISIYGAVIGGSLVAWIYGIFAKLPIAYLADRAAIGLLLGQGIGRIGDIINGEHHGQPAPDLPFSVAYTHPGTLGEPGAPVHLAVGYEMVYDLAVTGLLIWLLGRQPRHGLVYVLYIFLYGFGRLWVGFFRKDLLVVDGLGMAQFLGVLSMMVAVPWLIWLLRSVTAERGRRGDGNA